MKLKGSLAQLMTEPLVIRIMQNSAPIFTKESGERLCLVRMSRRLTQRQLGGLWGLSQRAVSDFETGRTLRKKISMKMLFETFGEATSAWILWGSNDAIFRQRLKSVHQDYWKSVYKNQGCRQKYADRRTVPSMELKKRRLEHELSELEAKINLKSMKLNEGND